jgi:Trk K+ transport system NAD-binding subunit
VKAHSADGLTTMFGSAEDIHLLDVLPLDRARYVVSAIPTLAINLSLLDGLRQHQFAGTVVLTAHTRRDADLLRAAGVTAVLEPFSDAAEATSSMLDELLGGNR